MFRIFIKQMTSLKVFFVNIVVLLLFGGKNLKSQTFFKFNNNTDHVFCFVLAQFLARKIFSS